MKTTKLFIGDGELLKDIIPILETDTIYNKRLPGIGATTLEIKSERNSIIILPFIPVIEGKCRNKNNKLNKDILGLFGGKNEDDVSTYLELRDTRKKKILCTPEKLEMVIKALKAEGEDVYNDYFLLIDECETLIKDVNYRPEIKAPLKHLFKFKNKAMISATPIIPRDARFENNGFKYVKIEPHEDRKYRVDLELLGTNNVVSVLRSYIREHSDETLCIFTNCSKTITKIINDLSIQETVKVFCAERLILKRFKHTGVKQLYTSLSASKDGLAKVNFFTSRFFSAVDMDYPEIRPHVIMVTNLYYSDHSQIDPLTDAIQISGRFRKGIKKMVHVSNFNPSIPNKSYAELRKEDQEIMALYKLLKNYKKAQPNNKVRVDNVNKLLEDACFESIMSGGVYDTYLADNKLHRSIVDSHYANYEKLKRVYEKANYFNLTGNYISKRVTDEDVMHKDAVTGSERRKAIAEALHEFYIKHGPFNLSASFYTELNEYFYMDEVVYTAYFDLGIEYMREAKFKLKTLRYALLNIYKERMMVSEQVREAVYIEFVTNQTVTNKEAKEKLQTIYDAYLDERITASGTDIKLYFETTELHDILRNGQRCRGYRLLKAKYPRTNKLTNPNAHLNTFNF